MFCAHLSQNWDAVQLLPGWDYFFGRYDEHMNNLLLILTLLTIISLDINGCTNLIRNGITYNLKEQLHSGYTIAIKW